MKKITHQSTREVGEGRQKNTCSLFAAKEEGGRKKMRREKYYGRAREQMIQR